MSNSGFCWTLIRRTSTPPRHEKSPHTAGFFHGHASTHALLPRPASGAGGARPRSTRHRCGFAQPMRRTTTALLHRSRADLGAVWKRLALRQMPRARPTGPGKCDAPGHRLRGLVGGVGRYAALRRRGCRTGRISPRGTVMRIARGISLTGRVCPVCACQSHLPHGARAVDWPDRHARG